MVEKRFVQERNPGESQAPAAEKKAPKPMEALSGTPPPGSPAPVAPRKPRRQNIEVTSVQPEKKNTVRWKTVVSLLVIAVSLGLLGWVASIQSDLRQQRHKESSGSSQGRLRKGNLKRQEAIGPWLVLH